MYSSRNTKIHAVVDALGNPIHVQLSSGDIHDSGITEDVLDHVELNQTGLPYWPTRHTTPLNSGRILPIGMLISAFH